MMRCFGLTFFLICLIHALQGQVKIDHVILAVNDLDSGMSRFTDLGFHIKEGTLHTNGLLNAHIKFANGSSFELMTIKGPAIDEMSREYVKLLSNGGGGVYLALTGHDHDSLTFLLKNHEVEFQEVRGKLWNYVTFPSDSDLAHLFFIDYCFDVSRLKDKTDHQNGIEGFHEVVIEGGIKVRELMEMINVPVNGIKYATKTGDVIVEAVDDIGRPKVLSVIFLRAGLPSLKIKL